MYTLVFIRCYYNEQQLYYKFIKKVINNLQILLNTRGIFIFYKHQVQVSNFASTQMYLIRRLERFHTYLSLFFFFKKHTYEYFLATAEEFLRKTISSFEIMFIYLLYFSCHNMPAIIFLENLVLFTLVVAISVFIQ